jgi:hypothetical protein
MAYYAERYALQVRKPGAPESATAPDALFDVLGGGGPSGLNESYDDLIRADTAALDSTLR